MRDQAIETMAKAIYEVELVEAAEPRLPWAAVRDGNPLLEEATAALDALLDLLERSIPVPWADTLDHVIAVLRGGGE